MDINSISIGDKKSIIRLFSHEDVESFSRLSGDINPIHLDDDYAKGTIFGQRIVHGALATSIFSTIFANHLPGVGSIYLKSENKFVAPIFLGKEIIFTVEVTEINLAKRRVIFVTTAEAEDKVVISGTAELYLPKD